MLTIFKTLHFRLWLLVFWIVPQITYASEWKLISEQDGIKVFTRPAPEGGPVSVKGEGLVDASVEKIMGVLLDIPRTVEWVGYLEEAQILRKTSDLEFLGYSHFKSPYPLVHDRDFEARIKIEVFPETKTVVITGKSVEEISIYRKDIVRAHLAESTITLTAKSANQTFLSSIFNSDPKGSIPRWIVNAFQTSVPHRTFVSLKERLKKKDLVDSELIKKLLYPAPAPSPTGVPAQKH